MTARGVMLGVFGMLTAAPAIADGFGVSFHYDRSPRYYRSCDTVVYPSYDRVYYDDCSPRYREYRTTYVDDCGPRYAYVNDCAPRAYTECRTYVEPRRVVYRSYRDCGPRVTCREPTYSTRSYRTIRSSAHYSTPGYRRVGVRVRYDD